ncbi:MAG: hypothetical protein Q9182_002439 [Xanthomendoza sp. 2 TL-2023]
MNPSQILIVALVCYGVYYAHWQLTTGAHRRRLIKEHGCKPIKNTRELNSWKDLPFGWTQLVANLQAAKQRNLLDYIRGRFLRNGCTYHFKLGFVNMVFTVEPQNIKAMLATHFKDWNLPDRRKEAFQPLLGAGIFTTDGAAWQHSRELLKPNFVRNQIADLATYETHVDHLIKAIPRDNSTVDLSELFFRLTIDSATEFLFGESTKCLAPGASSERAREFANAFNRSQDAVSKAARNFPILAKFFGSSIGKDIRYVHQFVDYYVKRGLEWQKQQKIGDSVSKPGQQYVFLHQLVQSVQDPVRLRFELLNVLLAGRDTTASLLTNVWFVLARRPDVWTKLRAEVDTLNGEQPTFEQIKNMKYLKYVMNEALRLYPVVPSNSRMAIVDTVLPLGGGPDGKSPILIPAKSTVTWSLYTMHRRQEHFGEDAEEFKPERWETLRPGWEYLPFNGGPRICIGQQFALTEASYTTIRLMQEFKDIESRDSEPWTESITLTCVGKAAKVALTPAHPTFLSGISKAPFEVGFARDTRHRLEQQEANEGTSYISAIVYAALMLPQSAQGSSGFGFPEAQQLELFPIWHDNEDYAQMGEILANLLGLSHWLYGGLNPAMVGTAALKVDKIHNDKFEAQARNMLDRMERAGLPGVEKDRLDERATEKLNESLAKLAEQRRTLNDLKKALAEKQWAESPLSKEIGELAKHFEEKKMVDRFVEMYRRPAPDKHRIAMDLEEVPPDAIRERVEAQIQVIQDRTRQRLESIFGTAPTREQLEQP